MQPSNHSTEIARNALWPSFCLVIGIGFLVLSAGCVVAVWVGANSVTDVEPSNHFEAMKRSVAFSGLVIPLAAIGGLLTILGLVFRKPSANHNQLGTEACPTCGRQNAATTKSCPRCETKLL